MSTSKSHADAASCAHPYDVALDSAIERIEREVGHLDICQRIEVARALGEFAAETRGCDDSHPACPRG